MSRSAVLLVDCSACWDFAMDRSRKEGRKTFDYAELASIIRADDPSRSYNTKIAFMAVDTEGEDGALPSHAGFAYFLERIAGFVIRPVDYRLLAHDDDFDRHRMSAYLANAIRDLRERREHVVCVTDAYELFPFLRIYMQDDGGSAQLAFFKSQLDQAWDGSGVLDHKNPVGFIDLDQHVSALLSASPSSRPLANDKAQMRRVMAR